MPQFPGVEILWKGTVSAWFRAIHLKLCGRYAFPQNFYTRKLDEITVFCAVFTTPIVNATTTPILNTAATPKHYFGLYYDMKTYIQSLEDKLHNKIVAFKSHLLNDILT